VLNSAATIVVSPGVSLALSALSQARSLGVPLIGDIELFARYNTVPVIAITGSNGKSTVTTLVGEMAKCAGKNVAVLGNIGTPVLDGFEQNHAMDLIVLELSSFQLESTYRLEALVATVLNISPDHLDRHADMASYIQAKHRIYTHAQQVVINQQDPHTDSAAIAKSAQRWFFTLDEPQNEHTFGLRKYQGEYALYHGNTFLLAQSDMKIIGLHNLANALSALALGQAAGLPLSAMVQALKDFGGLEHRCQWVAQQKGVLWINDSKGTNIGACIAALTGLGQQIKGKIIVLLGGQSKGADFSDLIPALQQYCRRIIVMGQDQDIIVNAVKSSLALPFFKAETMQEAVEHAFAQAMEGDCVLLSPACASLDQYQNFAHRGSVFADSVHKVMAQHVIA
jgi:UDP-N-acetylmuramoylalanine--D-glutamate ligase